MSEQSSDEQPSEPTFWTFAGWVHAPYFIFVRQRGCLSDIELLARLGLRGPWRRRELPRYWWFGQQPGILVANDAEWTHVMDNWLYRLWHMKDIRDRIARLGTECDVFTCSVGDADDSYDFEYRAQGRLVRKREVVPDRWPFTVMLETELGEPLPIEASLWTETGDRGDLELLMRMASSLGIETRADRLSFRYYSDEEDDDD